MDIAPHSMPWLQARRDVVRVSGADAVSYLHSQLSQDVQSMADGETRWSFVLLPTGRVEALVRVTRHESERFDLDVDAGFGEVVLARLQRFMIRVKVALELLLAGPAAPMPEAWNDARIAACWPAMGHEIEPGETIPAETGITAVAVSFTKGCYPGQELVERMDSRGVTAPRHLRVLPRHDGDRAGAVLLDGDSEAGTITSVGSRQVLAYVRRSHHDWSR